MRARRLGAAMLLLAALLPHVQARKGKDLDFFASPTEADAAKCRDTSNSCRHLGTRRPASRCRRKSTQTHCCATCRRLLAGDGTKQTTGCADKHAWCSSIGQRYQLSSCYGANEHECCATCFQLRKDIPDCPFGDQNLWCGSMALTRDQCREDTLRETCCETCHETFLRKEPSSQNLTTTVPTLRTTPVTQAPVDAEPEAYSTSTHFTHHHRHRHKQRNHPPGGAPPAGSTDQEQEQEVPLGHEDSSSKPVVINHSPTTRPPPSSTSTLAPRLGRISPYELLNLTLQARLQQAQQEGGSKKKRPPPPASERPHPRPRPQPSPSIPKIIPPPDPTDADEQSGSAILTDEDYYTDYEDEDHEPDFSHVPREGHLDEGSFDEHRPWSGHQEEDGRNEDIQLETTADQAGDAVPENPPNSDMVKDQPKDGSPRPSKPPKGEGQREEYQPGDFPSRASAPCWLPWAGLSAMMVIIAVVLPS